MKYLKKSIENIRFVIKAEIFWQGLMICCRLADKNPVFIKALEDLVEVHKKHEEG